MPGTVNLGGNRSQHGTHYCCFAKCCQTVFELLRLFTYASNYCCIQPVRQVSFYKWVDVHTETHSQLKC